MNDAQPKECSGPVVIGDAVLHLGDCLDVLRTIPDGSVDAVVTDPPAGIGFMGKTWDKPGVLGVSGGKAMPATTSSRNPSCKKCGGRKRAGPATKGCECEQGGPRRRQQTSDGQANRPHALALPPDHPVRRRHPGPIHGLWLNRQSRHAGRLPLHWH